MSDEEVGLSARGLSETRKFPTHASSDFRSREKKEKKNKRRTLRTIFYAAFFYRRPVSLASRAMLPEEIAEPACVVVVVYRTVTYGCRVMTAAAEIFSERGRPPCADGRSMSVRVISA